MIAPTPMQICITRSLEHNSSRWRYTVAHEIGHFILHRSLDWASIIGVHLETENNLRVDVEEEESMVARLEWQANAFAACLLMRRSRVLEFVVAHLREVDLNNFGHGIVFLDEQPCNQQYFLRLVSKLTNAFNVSKQAAAYRLAELRILNDQTRIDRRSNRKQRGPLSFEWVNDR